MNTWAEAGQISLLEDPLEAQFIAFHHSCPGVYTTLVDLAYSWKDSGHSKVGIGMLFEVIRWNQGIRGADHEGQFRLNNNLRSRYARLIMANCPDLAGFFEVRSLAADASWI